MSRGFVKEGDQEEPPMIPPRAALPAGVTNYVTPNGLEQLRAELSQLESERMKIQAENDSEKRRAQALIDGKINLLTERLNTARLLKPGDQPEDEVRFGAKVQLEYIDSGQIQEFQIVGVDEADIKKKKIAFVAPLARAITGKKLDEIAEFTMGSETRRLKILDISYEII